MSTLSTITVIVVVGWVAVGYALSLVEEKMLPKVLYRLDEIEMTLRRLEQAAGSIEDALASLRPHVRDEFDLGEPI